MILRAHNVIRIAFIAFTPIALVACGGGGSSSSPPVSVGGTVTRLDNGPIGGSVYGLAGREFELLLQEFGGISYAHTPIFYTVETLGIDRNGHFDFATPYSSGANYVHIGRQPDTPAQRCVVRNEPVTVIANKVTEVEVVCGEFLYVSNAADNTVSAFTVDATTGAIVLAGPPVPAGVSPIAMAGTSDKRYLYVVDSNSDDVSAYFVDPATGALTPIPGAPYPAGKNPRAIVLYRDSYLYVVNSGTNDISAYQIDQSTGVLTPLIPRSYATGNDPGAVAIDSRFGYLYTAGTGGTGGISALQILSQTGNLAPISGTPALSGVSISNLAFGATGNFLYAVSGSGGSAAIYGYDAFQSNDGTLTPLAGFPFPLPSCTSIVADQAGTLLYAAAGTSVFGFSIDAKTGELHALTGFPIAVGANASSLSIDPANQFLYVTNGSAGTVAGYTLNAATGALTSMPGSPFAVGTSADFVTTF